MNNRRIFFILTGHLVSVPTSIQMIVDENVEDFTSRIATLGLLIRHNVDAMQLGVIDVNGQGVNPIQTTVQDLAINGYGEYNLPIQVNVLPLPQPHNQGKLIIFMHVSTSLYLPMVFVSGANRPRRILQVQIVGRGGVEAATLPPAMLLQ